MRDASERGRYSRNRGKRGELELIHLLHDNLGLDLNRNYKQVAQSQNGDVEQLVGPYIVEVKNCATLAIPQWWRQVCAAADARKAWPCLAYKVARKGWRFVVPTHEAKAANQAWSWDLHYTQELYEEGFFLHICEQG